MVFDHPSLVESFERKGIWWLPEHPQHRRMGVLRYDAQQISLESFGELCAVNPNDATSYCFPVILGVTDDGQRCSLCNAFQSDSSGQVVDIRMTQYRATVLLVGCHVQPSDELRFSSGSFSYSHLEEWIGYQPFTSQRPPDSADPFVTATYQHRHPDPMVVTIPAINATLRFTASATTRGPGFRSLRVDYSAAIEIVPNAPQPLSWFEDQSLQFQRLLTFFVDAPVQLTRAAFKPPENAVTGDVFWSADLHDDLPGGPAAAEHFWHDVHLYRHDQRRQTVSGEERIPALMLVTLPDISDRLANILQIWFENAERLKHVYNLFFASVHTESLYLESQFLQLAQAIECYSRTQCDAYYLSEADYGPIHDVLVKAIPEALAASETQISEKLRNSLRGKLKSQIKYGRQRSFAKQVLSLLEALEDDTVALFCSSRDRFAGKVKATRNYYVHLDDRTDDEPYPINKLFPASQSMRIMISALLLKELGFDEPQIRSLITNSRLANIVTLVSQGET